MKITALVNLVVPGKDGNAEVPPGASAELPEADARDLIARGFAQAAAAAEPAEPDRPPPHPLAPILDGTIPEITAKIEGLNLDQLQALRALEEGGKTRKGVMAAIEAAIADLKPDGDEEDGDGDETDAEDAEADQAE